MERKTITLKINLTSVDFLDLRFDMKQETCTPYKKPNNDPITIHKSTDTQQPHPSIPTDLKKQWL